jgi:hypothetical protein
MRQFGEVPPWLATNNTPAIGACSGLGTGGGAGITTPDSGGFGDVNVNIGKGYSSTLTIALVFPSTPPTLFISGDAGFGAIAQATAGNTVTLTCTGASFAGYGNGKLFKIHYEWSVSK